MKILSDLDIQVDEGVYSPSDDTFLLVELINLKGDERVLEIGCGSGFISLHCASKGCETTSVDISKKAVENTLSNAVRNDLKIDVKVSDMFSELSGKWDVIIFNPPYLPKERDIEHDLRWDGGERGDETLLNFLPEADDHLEKEGVVYFIYSDRAPTDDIEKIIEKKYSLVQKNSQTFTFETIYAVRLRLESNKTY
ncbi:MAG: HemK2/MTQ2 family protein methyltransferase [Thermoplasmatota archaeon]